jgi:hypothetical protein
MAIKGYYKTANYHKAVWRRAKAETESYFRSDTWAWVGGIISALVSGFITSYSENLWSNTTMIPLWVSGLSIAAGMVFGLAFFVVVLWGWKGLWEIPAKMFIDKDRYSSKYNWDYIDIVPKGFDEDSEFGHGLLFVNLKPHDIQSFSVSLDFLMDASTKTPINIDKNNNRLPIVKDNNTRTWSGKKLDREGGKRHIELILWNDFDVWFQTDHPAEVVKEIPEGFPKSLSNPDTRIQISKMGAYSFVLSLNGQVGGYDLPVGQWEGRLLLLKNGVIEITEKPKGE